MTASPLMPAEWHPHRATWIAWPHEASDWPGKLHAVEWVYTDIARVLCASEHVEIVCHDDATRSRAGEMLEKTCVDASSYSLHTVPNDRGWLRDSMPTAVHRGDALQWVAWRFNAWAKYDNFSRDALVPRAVAAVTGISADRALRPDGAGELVLEGGAIDVDGDGTVLVTEECLLSPIQERNPGLGRAGYEEAFVRYLGAPRTIWLAGSCVGDDTHGHVDDVARFTAPGRVLLAYEEDPTDPNHPISVENLKRLQHAKDARGRELQITLLPMPEPVLFEGERLPASYANFYIANRVVMVPTFNDPRDSRALRIIADAFPSRRVIGIHARDLVLGFGTLHCLTQQEPLPLRAAAGAR